MSISLAGVWKSKEGPWACRVLQNGNKEKGCLGDQHGTSMGGECLKAAKEAVGQRDQVGNSLRVGVSVCLVHCSSLWAWVT